MGNRVNIVCESCHEVTPHRFDGEEYGYGAKDRERKFKLLAEKGYVQRYVCTKCGEARIYGFTATSSGLVSKLCA